MPVLELDSSTRSALRAAAHPLRPIVLIGDKGLTPAVLNEIDIALNAHGLLKVRVAGDDRLARQQIQAEIAEALSCAPVHHLGKVLVFYRPRPDGTPIPGVAQPAAAKSGPRKSETYIPKKYAAEGKEPPVRKRSVASKPEERPETGLSPRERYLGTSGRAPRPSLHGKASPAARRKAATGKGSAFSLSTRRRKP